MKKFLDIRNNVVVFTINLLICLFLLTSKGDKFAFLIAAISSCLIAIVGSIVLLVKSKKNIFNIIGIVLNILTLIGIVIYGILYII